MQRLTWASSKQKTQDKKYRIIVEGFTFTFQQQLFLLILLLATCTLKFTSQNLLYFSFNLAPLLSLLSFAFNFSEFIHAR